MVTRGDVFWLVREIYLANLEIKAGNKSSYVAGRRIAFIATACRFLRISRDDFNRYMVWVEEQVESGERIGSMEEPSGWVRKNPA